MEAVRIMCQLSELQINDIVNCVSVKLPSNLCDINDIDEPILMGLVRVSVDFDVDAQGRLKVLSAEILNRDWDVLETDSFAFAHYLVSAIEHYNQQNNELKQQNRQILNERRETINSEQ